MIPAEKHIELEWTMSLYAVRKDEWLMGLKSKIFI